MATYSSILVWKIPWMEEPGRLHTHTHKKKTQVIDHALCPLSPFASTVSLRLRHFQWLLPR